MKNIHAHTETTNSAPGYVSINDDAGRVTVSVRTRGGQNGGIIEMNRDQLEAMHRDVGAYLAATAPAPVAVAPVKVEPKPITKTEDSKDTA